MKYKDKKGWDSWLAEQSSDYGKACFTFAKRWAELMEEKIHGGIKFEDMAKSTSYKADEEGITGFMYGMAVSILAKTWEHGEELRQWHNIDTQLGNEGEKANMSGGTLNPALLNIGF